MACCHYPACHAISGLEIEEELRSWVAQEIGALAKLDDIRFTDSQPMTRSGEIQEAVPILPGICRNFSSTMKLTSALQKMHSSVRRSRTTRSLSFAGMENERRHSMQVIT